MHTTKTSAPSNRPYFSKARQYSLYIHIPYCHQQCPYCDFNISVSDPKRAPWERLLQGLCHEWDSHAPEHAPHTVYIGGGTPSMAPVWFYQKLFKYLHIEPDSPERELTLEVDPRSVDRSWLETVHALGVNRLSIGAQAMHSNRLRTLGRRHSVDDIKELVTSARSSGFDNISLDLIFATPGSELHSIRDEALALLQLQPEHISLYALTLHPGTEFYRRHQRGRLQTVEETEELNQYRMLVELLQAHGLQRYEVSNFSMPDRMSKHNQVYWNAQPYLGLGPGAESYWRSEDWTHGFRSKAIVDIDRYLLQHAESQAALYEWREALSAQQLVTEWIACGLRTPAGLNLRMLPKSMATSVQQQLNRTAKGLQANGLLSIDGHAIYPTAQGLEWVDGIALDLATALELPQ